MLRNHFKTAIRNLQRNKVHSFINIAGLSAGMAVAMLIGLWIYDELSFNKYHEHYDRIGQVLIRSENKGKKEVNRTMPLPLGTALLSTYGSDFKQVVMSTSTEEHIISLGDKQFTQPGRYMQAGAPEMLTLSMVAGNRQGLTDLNAILLSASLAKTLFGNADPMGSVVKIDSKVDAKVTGVYEDLPNNTQFHDVAYIAPWDLFISTRSAKWQAANQQDWNNNFLHVYVQIAANTDFDKVSSRIKDLKLNHVNTTEASKKPAIFLSPMSDWHLYSSFENGVTVRSPQLQSVWLFGIIGVFVLLLACINFMNLSTARSEKRAKEVGIRKSIGSARSQLISQFFSESFLVTALAFVLSMGLVQVALPWFNQVADKALSILYGNLFFWLAGVAFIITTGLLAGSYPAFYLSSFNPVKVLKGTFRVGRLASIPRKVLVVTQFTVSITLIIGTVVVFRQVQFSKERSIGYTKDGLVYINMKSSDIHKHHDAFHDDLLKTGAVAEMAESDGTINELWSNNGGFNWKGKDPNVPDDIYFGTIGVSQEFGKTVGWQFTDGRDFSREFASDSGSFVINEAAVKYMGLKNPVGEVIQRDGKDYKIIGVIKDVVMESPYNSVTPTVFFLGTWNRGTVSIRINPSMSASEALGKIEPVFKKYAPTMPFDYKFADEDYAAKFATEERAGKLSGVFAFLAIVISCLGLFGLASFVAEQRTKEIGVRKVLGASLFNVWRLLSREFVLLVFISLLIAVPMAYYFMYNWLQNYQYRTAISWWIFAAAGIGALVITLLTVSFQTIKATIANPVKSLRSE